MIYESATPLTLTQMADIRRYLGYPNFRSDDDTTAPYFRFAELEMLQYVMEHLRAEEAVFVSAQLVNINTAYANYLAAQANLASLQVAVVTQNPNEIPMRRALFVQLCRDLASWLGVEYMGIDGASASRVIV